MLAEKSNSRLPNGRKRFEIGWFHMNNNNNNEIGPFFRCKKGEIDEKYLFFIPLPLDNRAFGYVLS